MGGEAEGERACTIAVDQLTTYAQQSSWCFRLEEDLEHDFEDHFKRGARIPPKKYSLAVVASIRDVQHGDHHDDGGLPSSGPRAFVAYRRRQSMLFAEEP